MNSLLSEFFQKAKKYIYIYIFMEIINSKKKWLLCFGFYWEVKNVTLFPLSSPFSLWREKAESNFSLSKENER